eukprot:scaffold34109_cov73-Phaeocystis_antarctica.AAC.3
MQQVKRFDHRPFELRRVWLGQVRLNCCRAERQGMLCQLGRRLGLQAVLLERMAMLLESLIRNLPVRVDVAGGVELGEWHGLRCRAVREEQRIRWMLEELADEIQALVRVVPVELPEWQRYKLVDCPHNSPRIEGHAPRLRRARLRLLERFHRPVHDRVQVVEGEAPLGRRARSQRALGQTPSGRLPAPRAVEVSQQSPHHSRHQQRVHLGAVLWPSPQRP